MARATVTASLTVSRTPSGRNLTPMSVPKTVAIVPHTHWDREWYSPFQTFRMLLVRLLDQLLPMLETDETYAHFLLDGQTAVVDDYLEIRPEAEEAIRQAGLTDVGQTARVILESDGRISVIPRDRVAAAG